MEQRLHFFGLNNDILTALDNGEITALILLDLSAAFDTVDMGVNPTQTMRGGGGTFVFYRCVASLESRVSPQKADERGGGGGGGGLRHFFWTSTFLGQFSRHRVAVADPGLPKISGDSDTFFSTSKFLGQFSRH